jgi:hypothetical protein
MPSSGQPVRKRRIIIGGASAIVLLAISYATWLWSGRSLQAAVDRSKIDLVRVIDFAQRCNDCYHDHETFKHEYGPQVELGEFPVSGLRIYLDVDSGSGPQWVILRGTANLPDVIEDFEFVGEDEHELGIQVHSGFNKSLQECLPWLIQRLDPDRAVWVAGHSLGGAVAELLMATLEHRGFKDVAGVTFGQPKVTDARGVKHLAHLKLLRVVHEDDPVPMMPPVFLELGEIGTYQHSGPELLIRPDGKTTHLLRHISDRLNIRSSWADLRKIKPIDHDMTKGYLPALKRAEELRQIIPVVPEIRPSSNQASPTASSQ